MNFIFQGCQKMYVRVAISQKASKIDFPDTIQNIVHLISLNAMILLVLEDFLNLDKI